MAIIEAIVILMIAVILLTDWVPIFRNWYGRIGIGRYQELERWNQKVTEIGLGWLNKTPKIKISDNTRFILIDMLKGRYASSAIQHWQEASLLMGLSASSGQSEKINILVNTYIEDKIYPDGTWKEVPKQVDGAILAYALMKWPGLSLDCKPALDQIRNMINEHIGDDGTVAYRKHMKPYRYVDTIGFICPFLAAYGIKYDHNDSVELAVKQIKEYEKYGFLEDNVIPCHAYHIENKAPLGIYGWGRGLGWYAIGLMDTWCELPAKHKYKEVLEQSIIRFSNAVMEFQQENGAWNWTVTRSESRPDSSATAILGWFLVNASIIESIQEPCLKTAEKAIRYLMSVTRKNGVVDFSQGDTKDIGVYSTLFDRMPFTQGFAIRSINQYLKMNNR